MSYCRWSCMDYGCDLYVYADCNGGYTVHIADLKIIGKVPHVPDIGDPDFIAAYRRQSKFMDTAKRKKINLPYAGKSYYSLSKEDCLAKLKELKTIGFKFPDYVIPNIESDEEED